MNVMKQDAMDERMIERCKTCERQISQKKCHAHRFKTHTHTHTLNKSNQFYISKIS